MDSSGNVYVIGSTESADFPTQNAYDNTYNGRQGVFVTKLSFTSDATYTLTVTRQGTGSGTVTSSPLGINCGSDCQESYAYGTLVTLTATPASGSTFAGWANCDSPSGNQCTMTMNTNKTVTATFNINIQQFILTVRKAGMGSGTVTSTPLGITCGSDCQESYAYGTSVTLTATADLESVI